MKSREITIQVKGCSMAPLIESGDAIKIQKKNSNVRLSWGDIIVFLYKGELIAHRIIALFPHKIITKGDNAFQKETLPKKAIIIGKVITILKKTKTINLNQPFIRVIQYGLTTLSFLSFLLPYILYRVLLLLFSIRYLFMWLIPGKKK